MSSTKQDDLLEEVLLAFSIEPARDATTLKRYLDRYPQFAVDLVDLSHELRLRGSQPTGVVENEAVFQRAWKAFASIPARQEATAAVNPFEAFRGLAFAGLADTLRIPRSVLIAFRDRLVVASSVPATFMGRVAIATRSTLAELMSYLELPPMVAPSASYKAEGKPATSEKVDFETLLHSSGVTSEQKADIYTATE